jgi:hypothetical protein
VAAGGTWSHNSPFIAELIILGKRMSSQKTTGPFFGNPRQVTKKTSVGRLSFEY